MKNRSGFNLTSIALFLGLFIFALVEGKAAQTAITNAPSAWKLENYESGDVVIWFTSSNCGSGKVTMPAAASQGERSRFWATVSAAKLTGKKIFLYYDNQSSICRVISFGFDVE